MVKKNNWLYLLLLGGIGLLAFYLLKNKGFSYIGGGGSETVFIPPSTSPIPEPLPKPVNTTINLYNQLPAENKLNIPGSTFVWSPYTETGKLTVYPIVTESLVKKGVTQKYVPVTQLVTPQAQMLMNLTQKLTPSVTYNTGAGVRNPYPSLFSVLNTPKVVSNLVSKVTPNVTPTLSAKPTITPKPTVTPTVKIIPKIVANLPLTNLQRSVLNAVSPKYSIVNGRLGGLIK